LNYFLTMISDKIIEKEFLMELVYLWVKNYKNIKRQGFNFSARFRCEYDEENNKLTIEENKDYVSIFPNNINITAIVGENGSGKSGILNCLINSIAYNQSNHLVVFQSNGTFICSKSCSSNIKIELLDEKHILGRNNKFLEICTHTSDFFNSELFLNRNLSIYKEPHPMSIKDRPINSLNDMNPILELRYEKYIYLVQKLSLSRILNSKYILFSPDEYLISFNTSRLNYILLDIILYGGGEYDLLKERVKDYIEKLILNKDLNYIIDFYFFITKFERASDEYNELKFNIKNKNIMNLNIKNLTNNENSKKSQFLNLITKTHVWENLNEKRKKEFNKIINNDEIFSVFLDLFDLDLKEKERYFSDLSYGEKNFFLIDGLIQNSINKNILLLLDEIDLSYHPNWGKKFINSLLKNRNKNIHIVIASHSPFILSDLPKENIIFLEKGKQVYPFEDGKQTFGANIHTLLSHGFFMKDGLMGEFAKSKIDDVINYLNNDIKTTITTDKNAQNIIDIIGEPIIKRELQRMLKNKMELSNKTEIDTIKDEIKLLTERLEKLEPKDDK
jgi:ABC-type lipoprotein export system ATPase subunit/polyhydroxyalkanoate synthesis regulator phasin